MIHTRRGRALAVLCAIFLSAPLFGLEVRDGRIRLVVDQRSGHFSVFYQNDPARNTWTPLFYDQDARTTYPSLLVDQRSFKLGEASDFRTSVSRQPYGVLIEHRSAFCLVQQRISFIRSAASTQNDGILISMVITNLADRDSSIGLRYLFDTWLGEQGSRHFETEDGRLLSTETALARADQPRWLVSARDRQLGALFMLGAPSTPPDSLVAANWKRINDSPWAFDIVRSRAFTLLPYSINDSALAYYYQPQRLPSGGSRELTIALGARSSTGFAADPPPSQASQPVSPPPAQRASPPAASPPVQPASPPAASPPVQPASPPAASLPVQPASPQPQSQGTSQLLEDLAAARRLLITINQYLETTEAPDPAVVAELRAALAQLLAGQGSN